MSDMRELLNLINDMSDEGSVELHDSFDIELSEDFVIETGVVDITEDAIIVECDDEAIRLLEEHGVVLEKMVMGLPGDQGSKTMGEDSAAEDSDDEVDEYVLASNFISQLHTDPYEQSEDWVYNQIGEYLNQQGIPEQYWQKIADLIFRKLQGFAESKQGVAEGSVNDYFKRRKDEEDRIAGTKAPAKRTPKQTDYEKKRKEQGVAEGEIVSFKKKKSEHEKYADAFSKQHDDKHRYGVGHIECPYCSDVNCDYDCDESQADGFEGSDEIDEAEYHGRKVPLGKPMAGDVKKSKVYVRKPNGKVVKVNFGDKNMRIKKSNPKRRKSFRARHNCANPGPRWKARYWSCRAW